MLFYEVGDVAIYDNGILVGYPVDTPIDRPIPLQLGSTRRVDCLCMDWTVPLCCAIKVVGAGYLSVSIKNNM